MLHIRTENKFGSSSIDVFLRIFQNFVILGSLSIFCSSHFLVLNSEFIRFCRLFRASFHQYFGQTQSFVNIERNLINVNSFQFLQILF